MGSRPSSRGAAPGRFLAGQGRCDPKSYVTRGIFFGIFLDWRRQTCVNLS